MSNDEKKRRECWVKGQKESSTAQYIGFTGETIWDEVKWDAQLSGG
jgi:hypothetical protein